MYLIVEETYARFEFQLTSEQTENLQFRTCIFLILGYQYTSPKCICVSVDRRVKEEGGQARNRLTCVAFEKHQPSEILIGDARAHLLVCFRDGKNQLTPGGNYC